MNIKEAKEQIKNAMTAYFTKDQFGNYIIPIDKQRPVFLMGPPGIGKTAIMEQIASELGVALISYSMTHHTRQSALGLPYIEKETFGGKEYSISKYTMSEIIASVYEMMEQTGLKEGILFLDEINCTSETLAPSMLQFLQYKVFGQHRVPNGWIVVTAGNPPEYNDSVRDFDIVTWDRLKRIDVEPDFTVWKEFALNSGVHPAILTYLDIKRSNFYDIQTTVDGKEFVTARGWSDLSEMIRLYENHGIKVDESLISQYLQNRKIAKDFAVYYDLFLKYRDDYQINQILAGQSVDEVKERARAANFDERLSLLGLLLDAITGELRSVYNEEAAQTEMQKALKVVRGKLGQSETNDLIPLLQTQIDQRQITLKNGKKSSSISASDEYALQSTLKLLELAIGIIEKEKPLNAKAAFNLVKVEYDKKAKTLKKGAKDAGEKLSNVFRFCEDVFADGQEMVILVTEVTANTYDAGFIARHGCPEYFKHSKELLFYERQKEIISEIEKFDV